MTSLYVIEQEFDEDFVYKVGISNNPKYRIFSLQTGNPSKIQGIYILELVSRDKALEVEKHIHKVLSKHNIDGEWFSCPLHRIAIELKRLGYFESLKSF